ncbi:MAG: hypothetical protein VW421_00775 [Gammaproteobacteria bacterium]
MTEIRLFDFENSRMPSYAHLGKLLRDGQVIRLKNTINTELIDHIVNDFITLYSIVTRAPVSNYWDIKVNDLYLDDLMKCWVNMKDTPAFNRLIFSNDLSNLFQKIFDAQLVSIPTDWILFRIDSNRHSETQFDWHQDYPYNVMTLNTITAWIPCVSSSIAVNSEENLGGLAFAANQAPSQLLCYQKYDAVKQGDPNRIRPVIPPEQIEEFENARLDVINYEPGDLILFNSTVIHRSLHNFSEWPRLTINFRVMPLDSQELRDRDFRIARSRNPDFFDSLGLTKY